jgi:hypothetical protein
MMRSFAASGGTHPVQEAALLHDNRFGIIGHRCTGRSAPERIDRVHDGVAMFRIVIYFNAALLNQDCKVLASDLELVKFEKGGAREEELTYKQAVTFIKTALEFGEKGAHAGPTGACIWRSAPPHSSN